MKLSLVASALCMAASQNNRPIIGILTLPNYVPGYSQYRSYFPASYVKWLEGAGARVVPLPFTLTASQMSAALQSLNGALFTGGGADFTNPDGSLTPFALSAQIIFNESVTAWAAGETWPLWGTCLGHELTSFLAAANASTVTPGFDSENLTLPLDFTAAAPNSRLYGWLPSNVYGTFSASPITMNNHQAGVAPADFNNAPGLAGRFTVLATNQDRKGRTFVSSMEGKGGLPVFTTQFHPEKTQYEWNPTEVIDHSFDSIFANHMLAHFFVNQTRSNNRAFPTPSAEAAALIYNYAPVYTEGVDPSFEQCYFFP